MTPDPLPPLDEARRVLHRVASTALAMMRSTLPPTLRPGKDSVTDLLEQVAYESLADFRNAVEIYDAELARLRALLQEAHGSLSWLASRADVLTYHADMRDDDLADLRALLERVQEAAP